MTGGADPLGPEAGFGPSGEACLRRSERRDNQPLQRTGGVSVLARQKQFVARLLNIRT